MTKSVMKPTRRNSPAKLRIVLLRSMPQTVALSIISVIVALATVEMTTRIAYGNKFGKRPAFYVAGDQLGWRSAPNLDHTFYGPDYEIHIKTDSDGYRLGVLGEVNYDKRLIVLCGDSYAFGWGVSTEQTFASYLDEMVYEASNGRSRVVNLGVGGYGTGQEYLRLKRFLRSHPDARVEAIIFMHTVNDALDNVRSLGYLLGTWKVRNLFKSRHRFHFINLASYFIRVFQSPETSPKISDSQLSNRPYVQDMLWGFERLGRITYLPEHMQFESGAEVNLKEIALKEDWDMSPEEFIRREELTKLQRLLMLELLHSIHNFSKQHGNLLVIHLFIYTTPDWYIDAVSRIIQKSIEETDARAVLLGRLPKDGSYSGSVVNDHSGLHYNADFNQFWAAAVLDTLRHCISSRLVK